MRRFGVAIMLPALAGCGALRDAFSAHADVVASAAGQTLTAERLAQLTAPAKQIPLEPGALAAVAGVWTDYTLLAMAMARNEVLDDSALVLEASWPMVAQLRWEGFRQLVATPHSTLSDAQVDSAYAEGSARVLQHILLQVPPNAPPTVEGEKRRQIEGLRRQAVTRRGAGFAELAARYSEDAGSREQGGMLPLAGRGSFVGPFEDAGWQLDPGGISGVVRSAFGFHLIRRPPLGEVRGAFRTGLEDRRDSQFDSLYLDSLARHRRVEVRSNAPALAREALANFELSRSDDRTLVSYRGGRFRVRDLVRWLAALDPQFSRGFSSASDEEITQFLRVVTQRHIVILQADSAGVEIPGEAWAALRVQHDSALRFLERLLRLTPRILQDSAVGEDGRTGFAMARVDEYLERAVQGQVQFVPMPPFFGAALRERDVASISASGVARALERTRTLRSGADSLSPRGSPPGLTPAPGPAPVPAPGDSPPPGMRGRR